MHHPVSHLMGKIEPSSTIDDRNQKSPSARTRVRQGRGIQEFEWRKNKPPLLDRLQKLSSGAIHPNRIAEGVGEINTPAGVIDSDAVGLKR
jgi:hypothetical protein